MVRVVRASGHCEVASEGVHGMPLGLLLRLGVQPGELERAQGVLQGAAAVADGLQPYATVLRFEILVEFSMTSAFVGAVKALVCRIGSAGISIASFAFSLLTLPLTSVVIALGFTIFSQTGILE